MRRARRSHARRAPFIHMEVEAGATQRRFDAQRKIGGGGRPALMASQQKNPKVHGGVGIANQSGSTVSSQGSTTSNSSYPSLIAQQTTITTEPHHR
jgi:hypothetical protein